MIDVIGYASTAPSAPLAPFRFTRRSPGPDDSPAQTQEMLDFCAEHGIVCDIETIRIQDIETAFRRLEKADVKYRFVIDMSSLA